MSIRESMIEYAGRLARLTFTPGTCPRLFVQDGHRVYASPEGIAPSLWTEAGISDVTGQVLTFKAVLIASPWNVMIVSEPPYASHCFEECYEMPAVLDDMAQLTGRRITWCGPDRQSLAKALRFSPAVITEKGQLVTCGRTLYEAFNCLLVVEKNAEIFMKSEVLDYAPAVDPVSAAIENVGYWVKYSRKELKRKQQAERLQVPQEPDQPEASEAVSEEPQPENTNESTRRDLRREEILRDLLTEYGKKLLGSGLVVGTWGNCSVRLDQEWMLCTPSGLDYNDLKPEDMVKVRIDDLKYEGPLKPTSEKAFHAQLYLQRNDVNAVIHTHSKSACIFAACNRDLELPNGETIRCARYALSGTKLLSGFVVSAIGRGTGCLMAHHGLVAVGADLDHAFRNCRDIEEAAKSQIDDLWARK